VVSTARLSYEQAAWFRAQRTGLAVPFADLPSAAAGVLGAQAQIEAPARWALAMRTIGVPTSDEVRNALLQDRSLVRVWGQRDTVHMYAAADWCLFATAQTLWPRTARAGGLPTDGELQDFVHHVGRMAKLFTRSDVLDIVPGRLVDEFTRNPVNNDPPERMAATRMIWRAGSLGGICTTSMVGREQGYAARSWWLPDLAWPSMNATDACVEVVRRYLRTWGPARPQDVAHYLGARVTDVRGWLDALRDEVVEVKVEGAAGWLAHVLDVETLQQAAPSPDSTVWPTRLLPAYDTQMMSHAAKEYVVTHEPDRPRVWGKAAIVNATVIHRGRFVATWKHKVTRKAVEYEPEPLTGHAPELAQSAWAFDGRAFARHVGL
jgi:hypothetical protein